MSTIQSQEPAFKCQRCKHVLPAESFAISTKGQNKGGRKTNCIACVNAQIEYAKNKAHCAFDTTEWAQHPAYPDYWASSSGYIVNSVTTKVVGRMKRDGYIDCTLHVGGATIIKLAHVLVFESFAGREVHPGLVVDHRDSCKSNNAISNLRETTYKGNGLASYQAGTSSCAPRVARPVIAISPAGVETQYDSMSSCGKELGIHPNSIQFVCDGMHKSASNPDGRWTFRYVTPLTVPLPKVKLTLKSPSPQK